MKLSADTVLQLSDFRLHMERGDMYLANDRHALIPCNSSILELLNLFTRPRTIGDAAAESRFGHDWVRCTQAILGLVETGILVAPDGAIDSPATALEQMGFGGAREHIGMLNDTRRTRMYLQAIENAVQPGDVVVDLGAGAGVLSAAAIRAGAQMVHAIERTAIAHTARDLFRSNGIDRHVTVHNTEAGRAQLPEPADLLVSELIGNEPLSERVLELVLDARRRFLKPQARMIPCGLDLIAQCLALPDGFRDAYLFTAANTEQWSRDYGFDFAALRHFAPGWPLHLDLPPRALTNAVAVGKPMPIESFDLLNIDSARVESSALLPVDREARVDAVHLFFVLHLDAERSLGNSLNEVDESTSWRCRVWLLNEPIVLKPGEGLDITYRHDPFGTRLDIRRPGQ